MSVSETLSTPTTITALLGAWERGNQEALNQIITMLYQDLRKMAHYYLRNRYENQTLPATALVHEVYQRLVDSQGLVFENRIHFFNCACLIMRQVLVRYARKAKGKGLVFHQTADGELPLEAKRFPDEETLLDLDHALSQLEKLDPRRHHIVELKFFLGLSEAEIGEVLGASTRTIRRESLTARRWLARALKKDSQGDGIPGGVPSIFP